MYFGVFLAIVQCSWEPWLVVRSTCWETVLIDGIQGPTGHLVWSPELVAGGPARVQVVYIPRLARWSSARVVGIRGL